MEQGGQHNGQPKSNRKSWIRGPNPQNFELPNTRGHVPATIKIPPLFSSEEFPPLPSNRKTSPPSIKHEGEARSYSPVADQRRVNTTQMTVPVNSGHLNVQVVPEKATTEPRNWRPDVFVQNFVSQAYYDINNAPATPRFSKEVRNVDYAAYVSDFASPLFLPPRNLPKVPPFSGEPLVQVNHIDLQNYGRHFNDCVLMDWSVEWVGLRSYDLFAMPLDLLDPKLQTFNLHVPGLRENNPKVVYGDTIILRQLVIEPESGLLRGIDAWMNHGGRQRGTSS